MEELEKSISLAEGAIAAEQSAPVKDDKKEPRHCLNCNTVLTDAYCPACGQKDIPRRQTLGELLMNFISSFWSFEGKFFKTGQYLLFKPGFLATEYNAGRRERYFHPARMYVFISFVYFLLLTSLPDKDADDVNNVKIDLPEQEDVELQLNEGLKEEGITDKEFSFGNRKYKSRAQYDSIQQTLPAAERDSWLERKIVYRQIDLYLKYKGHGKDFIKDFRQAFFDNFSKILFWLLPIFALILKLLYIRRDYYYSEHLVFSIYYYNFFFLIGSLYMLANLVPWLEWVTYIIVAWIFLYLLLGMKRMYGQSWLKTIVKYGLFFFIFMTCVGLGFAIGVMTILMYI